MKGGRRAWKGTKPLTHSLHAEELQLQALHSEKHGSKAAEAAIYLLPEQGQQPEMEGPWYSKSIHTDRNPPFMAQGDAELIVLWKLAPLWEVLERLCLRLSYHQDTTFPRIPMARHSFPVLPHCHCTAVYK